MTDPTRAEAPTDDELAELRRQHVGQDCYRAGHTHPGNRRCPAIECYGCWIPTPWPCPVIRAIDALEREKASQAAELRALREERDTMRKALCEAIDYIRSTIQDWEPAIKAAFEAFPLHRWEDAVEGRAALAGRGAAAGGEEG